MIWLLLAMSMPKQAHAQETPTLVAQDLMPILEEALRQADIPEGFIIELNNPAQHIPYNDIISPDHIIQTSYAPSSGRFLIRFALPGSNYPMTLSGIARVPVTMPVLTRDISRGDSINAGDIRWDTEFTGKTRGALDNPDNIIGLIARRPLSAGSALFSNDLEKPILVKRGSLVTMDYKKGALTLRHQGQAQGKGSLGDIITIRNPHTDRLIKAVITAPNRVEVITATSTRPPVNG